MTAPPNPSSQRTEQTTNRWRRLLSRRGYTGLVFLVALILFICPFLSDAPLWSNRGLYRFLFASWGIIILALMLVGLSPSQTPESDDGDLEG